MDSLFISVGDPSGDIAGYRLMRSLKSLRPDWRYIGLGGRKMRAEGQRQLTDPDKLALLGFWEAAKKFRFFKDLIHKVVSLIERENPKAIILIDYPGFNLRLAKRVRRFGIPIIYYISPQIWAWGEGRINQIAQSIDLMLTILPFENAIYDKAGIKNQFVGHYLLDDIDSRFIKSPYNVGSRKIALLPGSRRQEIERMLPVLVKTAEMLAEENDWNFTVAGVEGEFDYSRYLRRCKFPIELTIGETRRIAAESRLVLVSSGTATLETGIIGRPMVVIYKTGWITYAIARHLVKLDKIALINIVAGRKIVPELIQSSAIPDNIAREARKILDNDSYARGMVDELSRAVDILGAPGASDRAAKVILEQIKC
jgi:lipid-A-disaccharide synthase